MASFARKSRTLGVPLVGSLLLAASLAAGCGSTAIDGVVVDHRGQPIADATITAMGTQYQALSDGTGVFSLAMPPGVYDVSIGQVGYVTVNHLQYDASERKRYELGRQELVGIPEQTGLLLFEEGEMALLEPGFLLRNTGGAGRGQHRAYCLDREASAVNQFKPGVATFFDHKSVGWRAFKLDEEGCAYRMSPNGPTSWGIDYNEKAEVSQEQVAEDLKIAKITFQAGEYFIANWDQGFFTKVSRKDPRFKGSYVKVD